MADLIRDAPLGQLVRYFTNNKYLQYPEEKADFACPTTYTATDLHEKQDAADRRSSHFSSGQPTPFSEDTVDLEKANLEPAEPAAVHRSSGGSETLALEQIDTSTSGLSREMTRTKTIQSSQISRTDTNVLSAIHTRAELEQAFTQASLSKPPTMQIVPTRLDDGTILVDWYTTDDPDNPQNWSFNKKMFASTWIYLYTFAVYIGSAIYTPSIPGVMADFGVSAVAASLGLALYLLAYGIGPLIFSPLSEIPAIGRNPPYMITFAIFVILTVPAALVDNFAGLLVLRFLQGFFGSPALATGGASLQDMYSLIKLPYVLCIWALAATCGPALGPIVSGFSVTAMNWHWSLWEMLWLSAPILIAMFFFLPETSTPNILLRRAQRLRKLTGDARLKSQSEIDQANASPRAIAYEALVRPMQLIFMDPSIGFTAGYVALLYAIFYSFFEAFPLVYTAKYNFNLGVTGLTFLSVSVAVFISVVIYYSYIYWIVEPEIRTKGLGAPERRLIPALFASLLPPIGLFIFGWTGNGDIHWIVSLIGVTIFGIGIFILLQSIFLYLPLSYPQYAASLFAGNDFARSTVAAAAVLFSGPMFHGMGVGGGSSLLGGLTLFGIAGVFTLWMYGAKLRARSTFAAK